MTQIRDTFADEAHFVASIAAITDSREQSIERERATKAAGTFKELTPGQVQFVRWGGKRRVLDCLYSIGRPIDELRPEFSALVRELPSLEAVASSAPNYDVLATLCSWAVLLDDEAAAETLAFVLERDGAFRTQSAALLAYFGLLPSTDDPSSSMDEYWVGRARTAVENEDDEGASDILFDFVDAEWFELNYKSGFRVITHKGDKIGHVGYWCYEAAAFAKVLGIDDSRLEGHKYYPWDLAHP